MKTILNKKIIIFSIFIFFISFFSNTTFAIWDGAPYDPGETNNPECLPSQIDCDVLPAVTGTPWTALGYLTSTNIDDTAYGAGWNGDITNTASKNAIYDVISALPGGHDAVTLGTANGLSLSTQVLSLALASTSTTGALSNTDWNTFNEKQPAGNYLTSYTETDPVFLASQAHNISAQNITDLSNLSGTNSGNNAANSTYANDYRAANFVAGTNYLAPNGSAALLTSFPTLNQSTTGNADTATNLTGLTASITNLNSVTGVLGSAAFTASTSYDAAGSAAAVTPTSLGLVIGTDVLAYRTFGSAANSATTDFAAALGADDNYVTDAQLVVLGNTSGTNSGNNAANSTYANDYRAANFVAGTNYLAPNGSAALLTSFPTLNQSTTGNADTATNLTGLTASITNLNSVTGVLGSAAFTASTSYDAAGSAAAVTPTSLGLVIGTDVLAYRTFGSAANSATTDFAAALGADDNYVTDAQLVVLGNTSGTNSGNNAANSTYANDYRAANFVAGTNYQAPLVSNSNIKTVNGTSLLGSGDITQTSVSGNAGTVTNATFTTALTVNTGTLTLTANAANTSVLTIGAGAVSVSGSNTGDQTLAGLGAAAANGSNWTFASQAIGDLAYATSATAYGRLADVATGSVLISGGVGVAPSWSTTPTFTGTNISGTAANLTAGHVTNGTFTTALTVNGGTGGTITWPTGAPTLTIPSGGGTLGTGAFATIANYAPLASPTFTGTVTLPSGTTLTAPKFVDLGFIADANGNEMIIFDTVTSAVNEITLANAATTASPTISASGETNVSLNIKAKGTGSVDVGNTAGTLAFSIDSSGNVLILPTYSVTVGATNRDLYIDNTGKIGYVSSAERYKKDISNMENISWLYDLRPVNYVYKNDSLGRKQYGLIAEEVDKVNPLFVSYNDQGQPETVQYSMFAPVLIKAIQELNLNFEAVAGTVTPLTGSASESFVNVFFSNIKNTIGTWLADATNGVTDVFANVFNAKEKICVDGECLTKDDIHALLLLAHPTTTPPPASAGESVPVPAPEIPTCVDPQTLVNNVCMDPAIESPVVTCSDGIQNQDETDIDTGGVCVPIPAEIVP
ncbi:MAG: tail fiber domain-containing protein [Candidatus Paceibacterota bacterium]